MKFYKDLENFTINRVDLTMALKDTGTSITERQKTFRNIPYYYTNKYPSTMTDVDLAVALSRLNIDIIGEDTEYWTGVINDACTNGIENIEIEAEYFSTNRTTTVAVYVPERIEEAGREYNITKGFVTLHGVTESGTQVESQIEFSYQNSSDTPVELDNPNISMGANPVVESENSDLYKVINAITSMRSVVKHTVLTDGYLSTVDKLYEGIFSNLSTLEDATFLQYMPITEIPDFCFAGDTSLSSVIIPNTVTRIGHYAFVATALEEVVVPNSVTDIGRYAFSECSNLTTVDIGKGVTLLKDTTFGHSPNITDVYLRAEEPVYIDRMLGQNHQIFDAGMTVTLHVPDIEIEVTDENDEVQTVDLMDFYTNPEGPWMNIRNVTVNVVAIED
jgi:hypothetical protein